MDGPIKNLDSGRASPFVRRVRFAPGAANQMTAARVDAVKSI
jgi:hypothetical protein